MVMTRSESARVAARAAAEVNKYGAYWQNVLVATCMEATDAETLVRCCHLAATRANKGNATHALMRLVKNGLMVRVSYGRYDLAERHPASLLPPGERVRRALGRGWNTFDDLAVKARMSRDSARKWVHKLRRAGYVVREHKRRRIGTETPKAPMPSLFMIPAGANPPRVAPRPCARPGCRQRVIPEQSSKGGKRFYCSRRCCELANRPNPDPQRDRVCRNSECAEPFTWIGRGRGRPPTYCSVRCRRAVAQRAYRAKKKESPA